VLVLNSIRRKSLAVGLASGLPNTDENQPAHRPKNVLFLELTDIFLILIQNRRQNKRFFRQQIPRISYLDATVAAYANGK
jgi:hypothetical protein